MPAIQTPVDVIESLKAKHGRIHILQGAGEEVVIRHPTAADWAAFHRHSSIEKKRATAPETLFRRLLLRPSQEEFGRMLLDKPALAWTFYGAMATISGVDETASAITP